MHSLVSLDVGLSRPGLISLALPCPPKVASIPRRCSVSSLARTNAMLPSGFSTRKVAIVNAQSPSIEQPSATDGTPGKLMWFEKKKELWEELSGADSVRAFLKDNDTGKPVVIDFYASWCSSCKAAYPALCKISGDETFRKKFVFVKANIQMPGVLGFIRSLGIKGIPTVAVFDKDGEALASFGASFRKMNIVKANLVVIGANPGSQFLTDPNGYVIPKPE